MKEGKDIVDISAPFVAGIVSGAWLLRQDFLIFSWASGIALLLNLYFHHLWHHSVRNSYALILLLFLTGLFCSCNATLTEPFRFQSDCFCEFLQNCRQNFENLIEKIPFRDRQDTALVKALILGDKTCLDPQLIHDFRDSGAAHILALSGFHLGIVYMIISKILGTFGNFPSLRCFRSILIVFFCGIYVLITGASPSLVRAFLFILINEIAVLSHRPHRLDQVLCTALFIQLVIQPLTIREVGFQLSYLAMAGICWIYPHLKKLELGNPLLQQIWDKSALTLSCQLLTGPAAYYYFGTFPTYFLLTNLLALPLTTLIMVVSLLLIGLGSIKIFPTFLVEVGNYLIEALIQIMELISSM